MNNTTSGHAIRPGYQLARKTQTGLFALVVALCALWGGLVTEPALAAALRLAALGDSLTAGYGLPATDAFPARLQEALAAKGHDVTIANFGVSGDTTAGGLARLDMLLATQPDGVLVELGANDLMRGLAPETARANLDAILARFTKAGIPVLLCGIRAPNNFGADHAAAYDATYAALADKYGAVLYPFFLDGVIGLPGLTLSDGLHPNAAGVDAIVSRILPSVETFLGRLPAATK